MQIPLLFLIVAFYSCGQSNSEKQISHTEHDHSEHTEHSDHNDHTEHHAVEYVELSAEELEEFDVELETATAGKLEEYVELIGEIVVDPNRLAHIVARFPGVVKEVNVNIGDIVQKDNVLAVVESNSSLTNFEIKSPMSGVVIDKHCTRGEVIDEEGYAFLVADLEKVWAELDIYQKDLSNIKAGQKVTLSIDQATDRVIGYISYVSPIVDRATRTGSARVVLSNTGFRWRPGSFVNAQVTVGEFDVNVRIPNTALHIYKDDTVVFVKTEKGFYPNRIKTGRSNMHYTEIKHGLDPGQVYVAKGGFTIKSELLKESFGGHVH
jgi:cobalt-zinc-cadmium efflux system membrane fusion protein